MVSKTRNALKKGGESKLNWWSYQKALTKTPVCTIIYMP